MDLGTMGEAKAVPPGGRARAAARLALAAACFGLGGCSVPRALNPVEIYREVSGANDAARPTPPGLDRPFPSLGTVPPRPDRPSPEARAAITDALVEDRGRSREPLVLRTAPGGAGTPSGPGLSGGPPPRPSLAAAPRVPWTEAPPAPSGARPAARGEGAAAPAVAAPRAPAAPAAARPAPAAPDVPDAPPAPPAPDLLGAPPPAPDLSGPPPARR